MATVSKKMQEDFLGTARTTLNTVSLLNPEGFDVGASDESPAWIEGALDPTTPQLYNTSAIVFQVPEGAMVHKVKIYNFGDPTKSITINLTNAPALGYDFSTSGTFTIAIGDLVLTVA